MSHTLTPADRIEIQRLADRLELESAMEIATTLNSSGRTVAEFTREERVLFAAANLKIRKG